MSITYFPLSSILADHPFISNRRTRKLLRDDVTFNVNNVLMETVRGLGDAGKGSDCAARQTELVARVPAVPLVFS